MQISIIKMKITIPEGVKMQITRPSTSNRSSKVEIEVQKRILEVSIPLTVFTVRGRASEYTVNCESCLDDTMHSLLWNPECAEIYQSLCRGGLGWRDSIERDSIERERLETERPTEVTHPPILTEVTDARMPTDPRIHLRAALRGGE